MAFYVKLQKSFEDKDVAKYNFGGTDDFFGVLEIDKLSGEVTLISPLSSDSNNMFFNRAGAKIRKEWKEGNFPDTTEWAS
jgi:hypothetical protein